VVVKNLFDAIDTLGAASVAGQLGQVSEAQVEAGRDMIWKRLGASTVFRQYLFHLDQGRLGRDNRNCLPWHAEGERQYAAFLLSSVATDGGASLWAGERRDDSAGARALGVGTAYVALSASVYLWSVDIEELADAAPLPKHVVSRDVMPHPLMFWSRDVARTSPTGENNWLLLLHTPVGIRVFGDLSVSSTDIKIVVGDIPYGRVYPDDFKGIESEGAGRILSRLAFLISPYVSPEDGRLPRSWRRELARNGATATLADPLIRVVKLRRDASENVVREREDGGRSVDWKHQWWVSGHYRAQWYPSEEAHKVIWIAPYLKGPTDKPVSKKVYTVVR
jgi:hypothetical protein